MNHNLYCLLRNTLYRAMGAIDIQTIRLAWLLLAVAALLLTGCSGPEGGGGGNA